MSIANEIQRIQGAKANIKSAIESKGVTVGDGTIDTYAAKISEISGGGGIEFDRYLKTAQFTSLNMFGKKEVELNFDSITTGFLNLFSIDNAENANKIVEHLTINTPLEVTTMQGMLYCNGLSYDLVLKRVTLNFNTQNCTNFQHAFTNQRVLEIVDGTPLDFSAVTVATRTGAFTTTPALKEVRFVKESIPLNISFAQSANLSTDTIQSIIDGLADLSEYYLIGAEIAPNVFEYTDAETPLDNVTSVRINPDKTMSDGAPVYSVTSNGYVLDAYKKAGTQQTLTLHADVKAKLTNEQIETIQAKNWELA